MDDFCLIRAMQRFFTDFNALNRFTLSLDYHQDSLQCPHCSKRRQLVSHGIIYKQHSIHERASIGKRILCSNRYGRSGCGRTVQLYVAQAIPSLRYSSAHLFIFLSSLLMNASVATAYQKATAQSTARNAWRWLGRVERNLMDFRSFLNRRSQAVVSRFCARSRRKKIQVRYDRARRDKFIVYFNDKRMGQASLLDLYFNARQNRSWGE